VDSSIAALMRVACFDGVYGVSQLSKGARGEYQAWWRNNAIIHQQSVYFARLPECTDS